MSQGPRAGLVGSVKPFTRRPAGDFDVPPPRRGGACAEGAAVPRLLRVLFSLLVAVVVVLGAGAPSVQARGATETILQDDAELLFRSDERVAQSMRQLRSLGVDRVRLNAGWSSIAPDPDSLQRPDLTLSHPDAYPRANWRRLDRAVRAAQAAGLQVMIDIGFWAPRWATTGNPQGAVGRARWNIDPSAFAEFTAAVVKRYSGGFVPEPDTGSMPQPDRQLLEGPLGSLVGGGGVLPPPPPPAKELGPLPKVSWWTIWNEPNHPGFLQPQYARATGGRLKPNTPHLYRRMVEATHPVIKRLQPDSLVLIGGLASFGVKNPTEPTHGIPPLKFVRELACVNERLRPLTTPRCSGYRPLQGDGFAHHPYSLLNRPDFRDPGHPDSARIGALDRLSTLLSNLVRMGRVNRRIANLYLTEFGYETNPPDPQKPFGLAQQARFINWAEYLAWKNPRVRTWPQFLLRDLGVVNADKVARGARPHTDWQSGLLFRDGTPKPAATSFKLALFVDCVTPSVRPARRKRARPAKPVGGTRRTRRSKRRLLIWGHVRPGAPAQRVVLEESRGASPVWRPSRTAGTARAGRPVAYSRRPFVTSASGVLVRHASWRRGVRYRLRIPGPPGTVQSGLAVTPLPCGRKPERVARDDGEY